VSREIVIIMGFPASGKSTTVKDFVAKGYTRFNRDTFGGTLDDLHAAVDKHLQKADVQVVLDNLYPSVESRKAIVAIAKKHKVPIRCYLMETSMEDSMLNACLRMMKMHGNIPDPKDFGKLGDPNAFPVAVIYKYRKEFQKPTVGEGFTQIVPVPFVRTWGAEYVNKAIFVDYDGTLRLSTGKQKYPVVKSDIKIMPNRAEVLKRCRDEGFLILGVSNQSGVAKGVITFDECKQRFVDTNEMLGKGLVDEFSFCPHKVPPISCYCRKPNAGMGAYYIFKHKLNPAKCVMVGDMGSDKTFAERCGFKYMDASVFFR
jgi:histidinol-phosphate phosphatase family protein